MSACNDYEIQLHRKHWKEQNRKAFNLYLQECVAHRCHVESLSSKPTKSGCCIARLTRRIVNSLKSLVGRSRRSTGS